MFTVVGSIRDYWPSDASSSMAIALNQVLEGNWLQRQTDRVIAVIADERIRGAASSRLAKRERIRRITL